MKINTLSMTFIYFNIYYKFMKNVIPFPSASKYYWIIILQNTSLLSYLCLAPVNLLIIVFILNEEMDFLTLQVKNQEPFAFCLSILFNPYNNFFHLIYSAPNCQ
jgi:hypothetical protein